MKMALSERHLIGWQSRLSARLGDMISNLSGYSWEEAISAVEEGRRLYHILRSMEVELRRPLEVDYFPIRLSQLEVHLADSISEGRGPEAVFQENLMAQIAEASDQLERWAIEAGTTVEDLLLRGAEAVAEGRIKKKPGPQKGTRRKHQAEGPWTPQLLKAEMTRLGVTFEKLGAVMDPPCGRPSVFKWIQSGIPPARQDQISRAMEKFERERRLETEKGWDLLDPIEKLQAPPSMSKELIDDRHREAEKE